MPRVGDVRTSLAVGFEGDVLPPVFANLRGRASRSIPACASFPFEDAQFEVVLLANTCVSRVAVREANRVLAAAGTLHFQVYERPSVFGAGCYTLPEVYSLLRDGFNIVGVTRNPWWRFWRRGEPMVIVAQKKTWRTCHGFVRGSSVPLSPFKETSR